MRSIVMSLAVSMLLAAPGIAAQAATASEVAADLRMAEQSEPMRRTAERFVERERRGEAAAGAAMLSRALVDRSVTVKRTTDAAGQQGFAFSMRLAPAGSEPRPFTVYLVEERGTWVLPAAPTRRRGLHG